MAVAVCKEAHLLFLWRRIRLVDGQHSDPHEMECFYLTRKLKTNWRISD